MSYNNAKMREKKTAAIICDICAREVEIISFGTGYVGVCCNKVFYNDEYRPRLNIPNEISDTYLLPQKEDSYHAKQRS